MIKDLNYWLDFYAQQKGYESYDKATHNFNTPDYAFIRYEALEAFHAMFVAKILDEKREVEKLNSTHFDIIQDQKKQITQLQIDIIQCRTKKAFDELQYCEWERVDMLPDILYDEEIFVTDGIHIAVGSYTERSGWLIRSVNYFEPHHYMYPKLSVFHD